MMKGKIVDQYKRSDLKLVSLKKKKVYTIEEEKIGDCSLIMQEDINSAATPNFTKKQT